MGIVENVNNCMLETIVVVVVVVVDLFMAL